MNTSNKFVVTGIFLSVMLVLALALPNMAQAQYNSYNGCLSNSSQRCSGNGLYWYDSCGVQQNLIQYCQNGCYNNACQNPDYNNYNNYNNYNYNNYNFNSNYSNCTYHAYKLCQGNEIFWYDSCGNQQDFYYTCLSNQTCQYGQCAGSSQNTQNYTSPTGNYMAHYQKTCYGNSLYWYDSFGAFSGVYKSCKDTNSCTADSCSGDKCVNTLKCDGSTCASDSADYSTYCLPAQTGTTTPPASQNHCGNGFCETTLGETNTNCPADCKISAGGLVISFFDKQDANSTQWQRSAQVSSNGQVYFMISAVNNSAVQIDNVIVSANIPAEVSSLGNLKLDGISITGDIVSGVNIGSVASGATKAVTFEGRTQALSAAATKQATATVSVSGVTGSPLGSDSVSIDFIPGQETAAAVSNTPAPSGFWAFLKQWYLWILGALVLIFLFIVVFKRLSSES